jgi:hypothetical protein
VDEGAGLAEFQPRVTVIVGGQLLFDDVGQDGNAEVVGLAGEVRGTVEVGLVGLEGAVAEVAPEDGGKA